MCSPDMFSEKPVSTYIISHPSFPINDFVWDSLSPDFLYYLRGCSWIIQMVKCIFYWLALLWIEKKCLITNCRLCSSFGAVILQYSQLGRSQLKWCVLTSYQSTTIEIPCYYFVESDINSTVDLICTLLPFVCSHT